MSRPRILLTNDDGIDARGLHALADAMSSAGEIEVVAPQSERSASGHAVSIRQEHALRPFQRDGRVFGHGFDGSPADCVKFAITRHLKSPPDLVVSGINSGPNLGQNVCYSGTVAAALEAAMLGFPAIAISIGFSISREDLDYGPSARIALRLARDVLERGLAKGVALNVNVPPLPESEIRGIKVVPQGEYRIRDNFRAIDPHDDGAPQWSNHGSGRIMSDPGAEFDDSALSEGFVTVTPLGYDMTAHAEMEHWVQRMNGAK